MNISQDKSRSSSLLTLMLFLIFAICIVAVILGSTGIYERLTKNSAQSEDRRVTAMFVAAKLRQNDKVGCIRLEEIGGADALVFTEDLDAGRFCTWIYCHEGWLYEILVSESVVPRPGDGERLIAAESMELELNDGLLSIVLTDTQGQESRQTLMLRSGGTEG